MPSKNPLIDSIIVPMVLFCLLRGASSVGLVKASYPSPNHDHTEVSNSSSEATVAVAQLNTRHDPTSIAEVRIMMPSGFTPTLVVFHSCVATLFREITGQAPEAINAV